MFASVLVGYSLVERPFESICRVGLFIACLVLVIVDTCLPFDKCRFVDSKLIAEA